MRNLIAKILFVFFYPKVLRESKRTDSVLALYGHNQKREPFEKLVWWLLRKGYHFINQYELYDYLNGQKLQNDKNIWLSFDDGWRSNYTDVLPVLQKFNIPATIFLATKGMRDGYYWFTRAYQNRESHLFSNVGDLWLMPDELRKQIIEQLPAFKGERVTMNKGEVIIMTHSRLISWGNHTDDHVMSNNCNEDQLLLEIEKCNTEIMHITGQNANFIYSFPNGNYDDRSCDIIKRLGFQMAVTVEIGRVFPESDRYKIKRFEFKNGCLEENVLQCFGIWTSFFNAIKKLFQIKNQK